MGHYHAVWYAKTRMVWVFDGEIIVKIRLLVLIEFTDVTDRQTDAQTPHDDIGRACVERRAAKTP